jgi:hypothetical protein
VVMLLIIRGAMSGDITDTHGPSNNIVLLHDAFHIGLVTGPRPAVLA